MDPLSAALFANLIEDQPPSRPQIEAAYAQMMADGTTEVGLINRIPVKEWRDRELAKAKP